MFPVVTVLAAVGVYGLFLYATDAVLDGPRSRIWRQAHNRLHSARGLLLHLCAGLDSGGVVPGGPA